MAKKPISLFPFFTYLGTLCKCGNQKEWFSSHTPYFECLTSIFKTLPLQKCYPTNQCTTVRGATVRKQYVTATTVIHDVGILKQKQEEKDESEKITNFEGGWTTSNYSQSKNLDFFEMSLKLVLSNKTYPYCLLQICKNRCYWRKWQSQRPFHEKMIFTDEKFKNQLPTIRQICS